MIDEESLHLRLAHFPCNDLGNAERFHARYGEDFVYVPGNGWFAWTGACWSSEEGGTRAHKAAQETVRAIGMEIAALMQDVRLRGEGDDDSEHLRQLKRHADRSGNSNCIAALLREAKPLLTVARNQFDADPFALGVLNGVLRFEREGTSFRPHERSDLITMLAPVEYDAHAVAPEFDRYLSKVQPDAAAREALQRWYGYSLTGSTAEQVLLFNYGGGSNGKSVLQELMRRMLGPYATVLPFASLAAVKFKDGSSASPDIARLPGIRLVTTSEPEPTFEFAEGQVKQLTGGEEIIARHLRRDFFSFIPNFKLTLAGNWRPNIRGTDDGIWRRFVMAPWLVQISQAEKIKDLDTLLFKEEAAGILNWMIEGAQKWQLHGLLIPDAWRSAADGYRRECDPIGAFLRDCTIHAQGIRTQSKALHKAYGRWAMEAGFPVKSPKAFGAELSRRGLRRIRNSVVYYQDIELRQVEKCATRK